MFLRKQYIKWNDVIVLQCYEFEQMFKSVLCEEIEHLVAGSVGSVIVYIVLMQ